MRRDIVLPTLALAGGIGGYLLRRWQLASAFLPEAGLFRHGAAATLALAGLTAILAAAFLLLVLGAGRGEGPRDFLPAFGCPEAGQLAVVTAAGFLLLAAGALGVRDGMALRALHQAGLADTAATLYAAVLVNALLCLPAGLGLILLGRAAYRGELADAACRLAPFPAFAGLVWLFTTHLRNGSEPVLLTYGFTLAAAGLLMLAHYYAAGFLYRRPCPRRAAFCALLGAVLGLTSLADGPGLSIWAMTLGYVLSALALSRALLRNTFGPPWPERMPSGADGMQEDETR